MPNDYDPIVSEIQRLVAVDRQRAQQIIADIPEFVQQVSASTLEQAAAQGLTEYTVSALMMRLNWSDSRERPGFYDNIVDGWPADRVPDPSQFLEAPWEVFEYCRKAGYEPYTVRALYQDCGLKRPPEPEAPLTPRRVNSDFRDYFFYIGIRWTVNIH